MVGHVTVFPGELSIVFVICLVVTPYYYVCYANTYTYVWLPEKSQELDLPRLPRVSGHQNPNNEIQGHNSAAPVVLPSYKAHFILDHTKSLHFSSVLTSDGDDNRPKSNQSTK